MNFTDGEIEAENVSEIVKKFKNTFPIKLWKKFELFDENYINDINIHWLKFTPPNNINHYILAALYVIIMVIGMCGNAFVVFMFLKCPSLRTPANTLIMNLAISDFLIMSKMPVFIINSIYLGPVMGKIGCRIYGFIGGLAGTVSICTLAAISLDRYYVIKFPLSMRFTSIRAKICVAIAWLYASIFSSIPLLNTKFGAYVPEGYLTSCSFDYLTRSDDVKHFIFAFFLAAWFIPFLLITFCYINIIKAVLNTKNLSRKGSESSRHVKVSEKRKQELKLTQTILLIIALWFVAWTPYATVALLGIFNKPDLITPLSSMIPALFCKTAACVDPFVYAISSNKFKEEVKKLLMKTTAKRKPSTFSVWTTQGSVKKSRSTRRTSFYVHSCHASEDIEEEYINIGDIGSPTITEENVQNRPGLKRLTSFADQQFQTPPKWLRPTFSNSSSRVKDVARNFMIKQRQANITCDYCDDAEELATM